MNLLDAKKALENGVKIKHRFFSNDEFIYLKDYLIYDENDQILLDFWLYRKNSHWLEDWEIVDK